jgi:thiamine transporter ThiT
MDLPRRRINNMVLKVINSFNIATSIALGITIPIIYTMFTGLTIGLLEYIFSGLLIGLLHLLIVLEIKTEFLYLYLYLEEEEEEE